MALKFIASNAFVFVSLLYATIIMYIQVTFIYSHSNENVVKSVGVAKG